MAAVDRELASTQLEPATDTKVQYGPAEYPVEGSMT